MDVPEPPKIVFEQPAPCADAPRAEEALRAALAPSTAPGPAWIVTMRVIRDAREGGDLHASGEIVDQAGAPVAHRTIDRRGVDCAGLARAIGVWASLVLDAEVQRALEQAPVPPPPALPPTTQVGWPEPAPPPEKPSPEAQLFLAHVKEERDVEVGIASLAMGGTSSGMIAGGSIFAVSEVGAAWFLRPSIAMGAAVTQTVGSATLGAGRFDACKRIPGNYLEQRGLQLDLCAGPELGFLYVSGLASGATSQTLPLLGIGPSIDFRGELGSALSVLVRGVANVVLPQSTTDGAISESPLVARAEVGLSWRLR